MTSSRPLPSPPPHAKLKYNSQYGKKRKKPLDSLIYIVYFQDWKREQLSARTNTDIGKHHNHLHTVEIGQ